MRKRVGFKNLICRLLIISVFLSSFLFTFAQAENLPNVNSDIIFLLDISGSMKSTDATREAIDMIQIAVDLCKDNDRIAFVAYNDTIAYTYDFIAVSDEDKVNEFKKYISRVQYIGETDLGLGLKSAVSYLAEYGRKDANRYVIMLSDGETDLRNSNTGRTEEDSQKDVEESLNLCKENKITLHTIGFLKNFTNKMDYLSLLSDSTGGLSEVATSPFMLLEIISNIMLEYKDGKIESLAAYVASDTKHRIVVPISETEKEALILIVYSSGKLNNITIDSKENKTALLQKKNYAVVKIKNPVSENLNLTLDYEKGSNVIIHGIEYYATQKPPSYEGDCEVKKTITKNELTKLIFTVKDETTGEVIKQKDFYENVTADITITDTATNHHVVIQGSAVKDGISAEYTFRDKGTYQIHVRYQLGDIIGECSSITEVVNVPPKALNSLVDTLRIGRKKSEYDVKDLFESQDKDILSYEIVDKDDTFVEVFITGSKLSIHPVAYGDSVFQIKAVDSDGESAMAQVQIHSQPFWKYHFGITVGLVALGIIFVSTFITGIIIILFHKEKFRRQYHFQGVITGNFINLKSKNDIGTMRWDLSKLAGKSITLETLFEAADINENLPDAECITFYPRKQNEILMIHESENSVFVNTQNLSRKKPEVLSAGDSIYIGFYGNSIELELKYLAQ